MIKTKKTRGLAEVIETKKKLDQVYEKAVQLNQELEEEGLRIKGGVVVPVVPAPEIKSEGNEMLLEDVNMSQPTPEIPAPPVIPTSTFSEFAPKDSI